MTTYLIFRYLRPSGYRDNTFYPADASAENVHAYFEALGPTASFVGVHDFAPDPLGT